MKKTNFFNHNNRIGYKDYLTLSLEEFEDHVTSFYKIKEDDLVIAGEAFKNSRLKNIIIPTFVKKDNRIYQVRLPNDCNCLFEEALSINIDLHYIKDVGNVCSMEGMFLNCAFLENVNMYNLDTKRVMFMHGLFKDCTRLKSIDLRGVNTKSVIDMSEMFAECKSIISLDLSYFNTERVEDMSAMFFNCKSLTLLNLSSFKTNNVKHMDRMFIYSGVLGLFVNDVRFENSFI